MIKNKNQRTEYKSDFNNEYEEYKNLYKKITEVSKIFSTLGSSLKSVPEGSQEYLVRFLHLHSTLHWLSWINYGIKKLWRPAWKMFDFVLCFGFRWWRHSVAQRTIDRKVLTPWNTEPQFFHILWMHKNKICGDVHLVVCSFANWL